MFTGIIEEIGKVRETGSNKLTVEAGKVLDGTKQGDSMAVNGACLTVTSVNKNSFCVDIMPETVRHTNINGLHYGEKVNLERAMLAGGRFGGHLVQGHIDSTGKVMSLTPEEDAVIARISAPSDLMPYVVKKGFIAIDGASLTVTDYDDFSFSVSLVNFTQQHTTLGDKRPGDIVNLEIDIIAKYIERLKQMDGRGITLNFLEEHGFIEVR